MGLAALIAIGIPAVLIIMGIRVITEYERGVVFRREIVMDVPSQEVITRDNVSVKVNAVLYFRVLHPEKAVIQVENYLYGTSQLAQTTLRSVCGQQELDELLAERDQVNRKLQEIIDLQTEPWGVKVRAVEVKQIDLPQEMQRAMAKQAEAEREKRSKVIHAEGEAQAAQRLAEAAQVLQSQESALQLRYLQTMSEIATENNSTIIFPMPIDILKPFYPCPRSPRRTIRRSSSRCRSTSSSPSTRSPGARRERPAAPEPWRSKRSSTSTSACNARSGAP
jgi:regulator of protease activity HflC (stomatin/prohibitin superfamily)